MAGQRRAGDSLCPDTAGNLGCCPDEGQHLGKRLLRRGWW